MEEVCLLLGLLLSANWAVPQQDVFFLMLLPQRLAELKEPALLVFSIVSIVAFQEGLDQRPGGSDTEGCEPAEAWIQELLCCFLGAARG